MDKKTLIEILNMAAAMLDCPDSFEDEEIEYTMQDLEIASELLNWPNVYFVTLSSIDK